MSLSLSLFLPLSSFPLYPILRVAVTLAWYQSLSLVPKMVQTYPGAKVTELVPNRAGAETTGELAPKRLN